MPNYPGEDDGSHPLAAIITDPASTTDDTKHTQLPFGSSSSFQITTSITLTPTTRGGTASVNADRRRMTDSTAASLDSSCLSSTQRTTSTRRSTVTSASSRSLRRPIRQASVEDFGINNTNNHNKSSKEAGGGIAVNPANTKNDNDGNDFASNSNRCHDHQRRCNENGNGESKVNEEEEVGLRQAPVQPAVKTVLREVVALVTSSTEDRSSESHTSQTSASDVFIVEEYDDDDDDDGSSTNSDASDKTEVTNNKSVGGTFVVNTGGSRSSPEKRLSTTSSSKSHTVARPNPSDEMDGSCCGLSIHMDNSSQRHQRQQQQQPPLKPRQPEPTGISCGALPFKGNPSKQRRMEKEKKREERRLAKKQQQQHCRVLSPNDMGATNNGHPHQDDQEFDLRSKPGFINVVVEDEETGLLLLGEEEDRSHGTNPSRKTAKSTGSTTHTSTTSSSSFTLTKERIRSHMKDYYEDYDTIFRLGKTSSDCWEAFFRQYFTDDVMWVRSSGNPLNRAGLAKLLSEDIVGVSMSIVSIDSIQLMAAGLAAVVVFTADQEYVYKGKRESDRTVITSVLHVVKGCEILIGHEHRCVGKPIPKDTRWES